MVSWIGKRVARRGACSRWPVEVAGCQTGTLIVVGRLLPLTLGQDEEFRAGIACYRIITYY